MVLPKKGDIKMLMGNEVFFNATLTSWVEDVRPWGGPIELGRPQNFIKGYVDLLKELDLHHGVLGMEIWEDSPAIQVDFTYFEFDQLRKSLPEAKIVDAGGLIWQQRSIKTAFEIQIIRELSSITNKGFKAGLEAVKEGVTEQEILRKMFAVMIAEGLDNEPMFNRVPLKGPGHYHAAIMGPHDTVLKKGDMLQFDGGPCHKGYWSDVQRNVCIGSPPPLETKLYEAALEAEQEAIRAIKPGARVGDIHRIATEKLIQIDPHIDINRCVFIGHGLGLHTHEYPYLVPDGKQADVLLQEGMYLAVEVSAFDAPEFKVIGGFPEDNVLVTKEGHEILTRDIPNHLWIA